MFSLRSTNLVLLEKKYQPVSHLPAHTEYQYVVNVQLLGYRCVTVPGGQLAEGAELVLVQQRRAQGDVVPGVTNRREKI